MNKDRNLIYHFVITNFIFLFIIIYFISHCFIGDRGYIRMISLKSEIVDKKHELLNLKGERQCLENKVHLISDESINKDYLDELARGYFSLINSDETYIIN